MATTLTEVYHPKDPVYALRREKQIHELMKLTPAQLKRQLDYLKDQPPPRDEHEYSKKALGELFNSPMVPRNVRKGILDSTSGTTGNVLIRQDLETVIYALFVKYFPAFERFQKLPSNGLTLLAPAC